MTSNKLLKIIDSTKYSANSTEKDIKILCRNAKKNKFRSVCVNLTWVKLAKKHLSNSPVRLSAIIDFPLGSSGINSKIHQAKLAKKMGADEIDTVINLGHFFDKKYNLIEKEIREISSILPTKFIIEHSILSNQQILKLAELLNKNEAFCLKLASGFIPSEQEAKIKHIKLIKKHFPNLKIKASGGIKTYEECLELVKSGADIIGTSKAIEISRSVL